MAEPPKGGFASVGYDKYGVVTNEKPDRYLIGKDADLLRSLWSGSKLSFSTQAQFVRIGELQKQQYPLMVNPLNPKVRERELGIIREVSQYPVDGIIYDDRLRFGGMNADFSEETRQAFEKQVGRKLAWPEDVFRYTITPQMVQGIRPGPYYDSWMAFRAQILKNWLQDVRAVLEPNQKLGVYAGSWYGEYPALGNNYASPDVNAGFWFMSKSYRESGFANKIDFLITGCYYPTATIFDAMGAGKSIGATVEAAGYLSNRMTGDQCWTYAGISLDQFKNNRLGLENALSAACASTQGVMVFDLSHNIEPLWPVFKGAFIEAKVAPHATKELDQVRKRKNVLLKAGYKEPPIVITSGSAGIGQ